MTKASVPPWLYSTPLGTSTDNTNPQDTIVVDHKIQIKRYHRSLFVLFAVGKMYNYQVYELWLIIPATVVSVLPYVVIILLCCSARLRSSTAGMVKFLLGDLVGKREEKDGTKYLIQGYPLKKKLLYMVMFYCLMITSCALMTFWYEFLVDVTYSCDTNLDCYPIPALYISFSFNNFSLNIPPIVNCSDYVPLPDNMTIICFTFTFDYSRAFGAAGGVFAFAVFGIRTVIGIMIWLKSECQKCCLFILLSIFFFVLGMGGFLLAVFVPVFRPLLLGPTRMVHFFGFIITFYFGFIWIPLLVIKYQNKLENTESSILIRQ